MIRHANDGTVYGTGVCVASDGQKSLILTNAHFARGSDTGGSTGPQFHGLEIRTPAKLSLAATLIAEDLQADLALLVAAGSVPVATLSPSWPPAGSEVQSLGYPMERQRPLSLHRRDAMVVARGVTSSAPELGESGSPIFHGGQMVGIIYGRTRMQQHLVGLSTPADEIRSFLDDARQHIGQRYPILGRIGK